MDLCILGDAYSAPQFASLAGSDWADADLRALYTASETLIKDYIDGECTCFDRRPNNSVLPGEGFSALSNDTNFNYMADYPSTTTLFEMIDSLANPLTLFENSSSMDFDKDVVLQGGLRGSSRSGSELLPSSDAFDCGLGQQLSNYITLDKITSGHDEIVKESPLDTSDTSNDRIGALPTTALGPYTYFDGLKQENIVYIALDKLLTDIDNDEILPRIHRAEDEYDTYPDPDVAATEIAKISASGTASLALANQENDSKSLATRDLLGVPFRSMSNVVGLTSSRSINDLFSNSSYRARKARRRPHLTLITHLERIQELSESESISTRTSNSTSSASSIDFAERRGFLRPLSTRRVDISNGEFLDDEDKALLPKKPSERPDTSSNCSSALSSVEDTSALFDDAIWRSEPDLTITSRDDATSTPLIHDQAYLGFQSKFSAVVTNMIDCIQQQRIDELIPLASELRWTLNGAPSSRVSIFEPLGDVIEILLDRLIALGTT